MEWTQEQVLRLIEMYRARPVLWDCTDKEYKLRNKRYDAYMEIAVSFAEGKDEIERKIKNLQSHFARELKKVKDSSKSGSGADTVYNSKWFAFKSLMFLVDRNKPRKTEDTEASLASENEDEDNACEDRSQNHENTTNGAGDNEHTQADDDSKIKLLSPKGSIPTRKRKTDNSLVNEAYSMMTKIYSAKRERDEFTLFGEQIAVKLRKLPTAHAQLMVQHIINTTLFEAELGKYNNPTPINPYGGHQHTSYPSPWAHASHSQPQTPTYAPATPFYFSNDSNFSLSQPQVPTFQAPIYPRDTPSTPSTLSVQEEQSTDDFISL